MKITRNFFTAAYLIVLTGALASCADLPYRQPGERAAELPTSKGMILFAADAVGGTAAKRIQYSDNEQRVDYALFKGQGGHQGAQAEFIYMERPYNQLIAFDFPYTIRDKVEAWNLSKGQPTAWENALFLEARVGGIYFRPYRLTALNRQCFGISGEWDVAQDDPELRFTRIMFGYYCAPPGKAISADEMIALADRIGIRGVSERAVDYADPVENFHRDVDGSFKGTSEAAKAIELAQGVSKGASQRERAGISEFPFRYADYYQISGGSEVSN